MPEETSISGEVAAEEIAESEPPPVIKDTVPRADQALVSTLKVQMPEAAKEIIDFKFQYKKSMEDPARPRRDEISCKN